MKPSQSLKTTFSVLLTVVIAVMGAVMAPGFVAQADNTLRGKRLKVVSSNHVKTRVGDATEQCVDTIFNPSRDSIQVSGYDKPLHTNRETMLITNNFSRQIEGFAMTMTYKDMQDRQLHQRTDTLSVTVPSGETRMIRFSTWDTQYSYYYHRGKIPRTANVTPYDISCHIDFITLRR